MLTKGSQKVLLEMYKSNKKYFISDDLTSLCKVKLFGALKILERHGLISRRKAMPKHNLHRNRKLIFITPNGVLLGEILKRM